MEQSQKDNLVKNLKYQVDNKNLKQINKFEYSNFKFKFNIIKQEDQEAFVEFIDKSPNNLMPWDVCNYFLDNNIKYSINFRYVKEKSLKSNWTLFKTVMFLKKEKLKVYIKDINVDATCRKKMINNKERYDFLLQILNLRTKKIYFIQGDSNIWWKPKKIVKKDDKICMVSYGWLFAQVGKAEFMNKDKEE